jgi:hypothetical protein
MIQDCATALMLVGLVQIALSWVAGVGTAADTLVYMPIAALLYRFNSRFAALLLLLFSLLSVVVIDTGFLLGIEASTDLILVAILLWSSVRSVEATSMLRAEARGARTPKTLVLGSRKTASEGRANRHPSSKKAAWLAFAAMAFAFAAAPRFLPPLAARQEAATVAAPAAPAPVPAPAAKLEPHATMKTAGDGHLSLHAPTGLIDPRSQEPDIASLAEGFVPSAMELAALFVSPADLETFRRSHQFAPTRYVMIQAVRQPSSDHVSQEALVAAKAPPVATSAERLGRLIGADAALSQWLGAVARPLGASVDLDGARVQSQGIVAESDRSVSFASVVEVPASTGKPATSRVVITSLVLARGKVLVVYTHGAYTKSDDVSSARDITRDVVRNVVDENPA